MSNVFFYGRQDLVEAEPFGLVNRISFAIRCIKLCGTMRSFFMIDEKNNTWAFGDNQKGQLGLGYTSQTKLTPTLLRQQFRDFSLSDSYVYAQGKDGLYFWGEAQYGCAPTRKVIIEPTLMEDRQVQQMVSQHQRFHFIQDGDLWGVGLVTMIGVKLNKICTSKAMLIQKKIKQIVCSSLHSLALSEDGNVYSWGSAKHGELGHQMKGYNLQVIVSFPQMIEGLKNIKEVQCSDQYSLALNQNGELYEWGKNYQDIQFDQALIIKKIQFPKSVNIIKIHSSCSQNACLDQLGRLYVWSMESPQIRLIKCQIRCEEFLCGQRIVLFIGKEETQSITNNFKQKVRQRLGEIKEYVDMKNSKIRNIYYDENKRVRCLSDINIKSLSQGKKKLEMKDILPNRKIIRKPSMYMLELKRKSSISIGDIINPNKQNIRCSKNKLTNTIERTIESCTDMKWSLTQVNPQLKQALIIDPVNDIILESERTNPLYIPFEQDILKRYRLMSQQVAKTARPRINRNQTPSSQFTSNEPELTKYEYMKRITNGFKDELLKDNLKEINEDQFNIIKSTRRYKNDTAMYQKKYLRMKILLDKKKSEMNQIIKDN